MATPLAQWLLSNLEKFQKTRSLSMEPRGQLDETAFEARIEEVVGNFTKLFEDLESLCNEPLRTERHLLLLSTLLALNTDLFIKHDSLSRARKIIPKMIELLRQLSLGIAIKSFECSAEDNDLVDHPPNPVNDPIRAGFAFFLIEFYNNLAIMKQLHEKDKASIEYLLEAKKIYENWEKQDPRVYTFTYEDLFEIDPNLSTLQEMIDAVKSREVEKKEVEICYIHTASYLAAAYQKIEDFDQSASYCHLSLRLELPYLGQSIKIPDYISWSLNAATLSQYFIKNGNEFNVSRHMICCARRILYGKSANNLEVRQSERFRHAEADIARIEVIYCIRLLDNSFELISNNQIHEYKDKTYQFKAYLIKDDEISEMEQKIPQFPARNLTEAKEVFKHAMMLLEQAKKFFTLDERCSDYISCVMDQSLFYSSLINYEKDVSNMCKLQKRRIDLLEPLLKQLNPQYFLPQYRKILYDLGDIYSQRMTLKIHQYGKEKGGKQGKELVRMNQMASQAIIYHYRFLTSFSYITPNPPKVVSDLSQVEFHPLSNRIEEANYIDPILTAYIMIGKTYSNLFAFHPEEAFKNWTTAQRYYQEVKNYVERNKDHCTEFVQGYMSIIDEMLELIPKKLDDFNQQILSMS